MYPERRKKLAAGLGDGAVALVYSGDAPYKVGDEKYPFEVDRDFYYLTGIDRPRMILMIFRQGKRTVTQLFLERYDEYLAKWVGGKMKPEEAYEISGIEDIQYLDEFEDSLGMILSRYGEITLFPALRREELGQDDSWLTKEVRRIRRHYPDLAVRNLAGQLTEARMVKDADEIRQIEQGIAVTRQGLETMWRNLSAGINESEAEAWFDYELKKARAGHSFDSIFASGKNAVTLHYSQNNTRIPEGSLLLTDLGAASGHYCADITRTVPVSGRFTRRQREIYEAVLKGNRLIINLARNGMTLRQLNDELIGYYKKALPKLGLKKGLDEYYFHGVSHMLGLQCHDVSAPNHQLTDGNVFTVEPGLYIEDEGIGIRIEDNVVMEGGRARVLSKDIIKDPDEIERFFAGR